MSEPTPPVATAIPPAAPPPLIRATGYAGESANDYFLKRLVPAWVISGAVNVIVLLACISVAEVGGRATLAVSQEVVQAVVDEKPEEEKKIDLTNPDLGLQSDLAAAVDVPRVEERNVEAPVDAAQPIGVANTDTAAPTDIPALAGLGADMKDLGVAGDAGDLKGGTGGTGGSVIAKALGGRSGASKRENLKSGGGNDASEAAVARGMLWLKGKQRENGSWVFDGSSAPDTIAATGMSLLPFLAAGQTHKKFAGNNYQDVVAKGVTYLLANQQANGSFRGSSGMYSHAIAAIALCELYGMTGDKGKLFPACKKAIDYIQSAQGRNGSWGYQAKQEGDTSIVGWQIQALQSAKQCKDIPVDERVLKGARDFLNSVSVGARKSQYGYSTNTNPTPTLSAVGLLCRYYADGWGPTNPGMADGVDRFMKAAMPDEGRWNLYYYYYATQVVHFHEGDKWHKEWNPKMRDLLVRKQKADGKDAGSWEPDNQLFGTHCGRLGATCLSLLTLEVYYRHLPLYKRDTGGLKELERTK